MIKTRSLLATSSAALALLATPAFAQDADDEIIVTATKRQTTLQDTPVAVTVTGVETIERAEIQDLLDLQSVVPSLRVSQLQSSTQTDFVIRGFGNGANNPGIEPSVGVFIDGVYRSRSAAQIADLPSLERVEVLPGPQSTLFGKNASAGVISIVTESPQFTKQGYVEAGVGNFDLFQGKAYITAPLSDSVAYSVGGSFLKRDGFITDANGGPSLNDRDRFSLRGQILVEPNDTTSMRFIADYGEIDEICCGTQTFVNSPVTGILTGIAGRQIQSDPSQEFSRVSFNSFSPRNKLQDWGLSAQIDHDFDNDLTLTSITAYRENDSFTDGDSDFTTLDLLDSDERGTVLNTFTQELRLTSNFDGPFNFQIGGFYFDESVDAQNTLGYGADLRSYLNILAGGALPGLEAILPQVEPGELFGDQVFINEFFTQEDETYSLFGTVDFEVTDRFTITGGLNYTDVSKDVTARTVNNDTFSNLSLTGADGTTIIATNLFLSGNAAAGIPSFSQALGGLPFTPANLQAAATGAFGPAAQGYIQAVQAGAAATAASSANPLLGLTALQFQPQFLDFPNSVETGQRNDDKLTWSIRGNFEVSDDLSVYGAVATGFKASSFNLSRDSRPFLSDGAALQAAGLLPNNFDPATGRNFGTRFAEPEEAIVYEAGAKFRFDRGNLNVAVFRQELENFQGNAFVGTLFVLTNAGETRVDGIEVQSRFNVTDNFSLDLAGTFLDAEYLDFQGAPGPISGTTIDLTGETPDNISDVSLSIGATYEHEFASGWEGYVRGDWQYEAPTQISENLSLEGRAIAATANPLETTLSFTPGFDEREQSLFNASIGLESPNGFGIQFWGRNIFGDDFASTLFPGVAQFGIVNGYPNALPTYGVNLRKEF
ncbi:MAG: TonB-dependent receptor [Litorimonas sp.]